MYYAWMVEPGVCASTWIPLSVQTMCQALAGRSLLFLGDSLSQEAFWSLVSLFSHHGQWQRAGIEHGQLLCPRVSNLTFLRNDQLALIPTNTTKPIYADFRRAALAHSVIILNKGAHFVANELFIRQLNETLDWMNKFAKNATVFFRTTPAGHPGCFTDSIPGVPNEELSSSAGAYKLFGAYNWHLFAPQMALTRQFLLSHFPQIGIIDVVPSTAVRRDSHLGQFRGVVDCLHYCAPGPIDHWNEALLNALVLRSKGVATG